MKKGSSEKPIKPGNRAHRKQLLALGSVLVGVVLTATKFVVGILTGSLGILSEALHSFFDLGAALITFFSVRISSRPADETHPYGHGKAENISALVQALLLLATCAWVVHEAVQRLTVKKVEVEATFWSFCVMILSICLDLIISRLLYSGARKYGSQALEADALHYSSDILSSAVVIAGLTGARCGYPDLDPIAALGVALLVGIASVRLSTRAVHDLLDGAPRGLVEQIRSQVTTVPGVETTNSVRVRRAGSSTFVDMIVGASRLLSLDQGDRLSDRIEAQIKRIVPESDVIVHLHPVSTNETIQDAARAISKRFPRIQDVHNIWAYRDGQSGRYFLSLHAKIAPDLSLEDAHRTVDELEEALRQELPELADLETHLEIADGVSSGRKAELGREELETLRAQILEDPLVLDLCDVRLHRLSTGNLISCRVHLSRELSLERAHAIATRVEEKIRASLPEATGVVVHTEPVS